MAEIIAVLVKSGASLTLATVIVNSCVFVFPLISVAVITTLWLPTSLFVGVPVNLFVDELKDNHDGIVVPDKSIPEVES